MIIYPTSAVDVVSILKDILLTGDSDIIKLKIVSFEVKFEELIKIIDADILYTMTFNYAYVQKGRRESAGYYLDFNLMWGSLSSKVADVYEELTNILESSSIKDGEILDVEFFGMTGSSRPWERIKPIDVSNSYLSTTFSQSGFTIDPNNQGDIDIKVLSILFWMMMEPNIETVIKLPTGDMTVHIHDYFDHSDIMSFAHFHNHELSDEHDNIISYIMKRFKDFYIMFLDGSRDAEVYDLR